MTTRQQKYRSTDKGKLTQIKYTKSEKFKSAQRKARIKRLYGITIEQYDDLIKKQHGTCAICKQVSTKRLHVDHDHNTGKVRGLLCENCNKGLGLFGENVSSLQTAIKYLKTTRE